VAKGPLPQHCPPGSVAPTLPSPAGGRIRGGGRDVVCVLQAPKLGDVLVECLLAIGTELIAALRKQYVTGDDPFLLLRILLIWPCSAASCARACCNPAVCFSHVLCDTHAPSISAVEQYNARRGCQIYLHGSVSHQVCIVRARHARLGSLDRQFFGRLCRIGKNWARRS